MYLPLLLVMFLFLGSGTISDTYAASSRKCTIKQFVGSVKIRRGKSVKWTDAKLKMPLREKDAIRTFIESEAELETTEGTIIKVGENSTLELSTLDGNANEQNTSVKIMNGAVLANVKKLMNTRSSFEFETPTATAAIRGTIVGFEVKKDQTRIKVYEGRVVVTPQGSKNSIELQRNQMGTVKKGDEKVAVEKFSETTPVLLSGSAADTSAKDSTTADTVFTDTLPADTTDESMNEQDTSDVTNTGTLLFSISIPAEKQEFSKPVIPVSGVTSKGAKVTVLGISIPVTASGSFNGQVPIANEAGELTLEFEASIDGRTKNITRTISYKPEYRFIVTSPAERQNVSTQALMIKGEVVPVNAEVSVSGKQLSVSSTGQFSGYITIPDEEGELALDFEITTEGISRTETRHVIYKKPPDTYRPQLAASIAKSCWNITVFDRTEDEEITLWYEIDGSKDSKILNPNESFCLPFENGIHSYRIYAQDKANNLSSTEALVNHPYLANATWIIQMRKPAGDMALDIPPASPAGETSHFPIEFTIENLPDDDMKLIKEIHISNKTNNREITLKTFTDNFIETDVELVRQRKNQIQIDVHDINNIIKSHAVIINVR